MQELQALSDPTNHKLEGNCTTASCLLLTSEPQRSSGNFTPTCVLQHQAPGREVSSHLPSPNPPHKARWIEKLSHMDFTRCPPLLFGCWLYGRVCHRDSKPLKTIGHSHTDSLRRIGEASFLKRGVVEAKAPHIKRAGTIAVTPRIYPLFQLVQSEAWPPIMEKYLGLDPGSHATFKSQRHQGRPHQDDLEPLPPSMEAWGRIQQRQATRIWPQGGGKRPAQKKRSRGRGRSKPN